MDIMDMMTGMFSLDLFHVVTDILTAQHKYIPQNMFASVF